MSIPLNPEIALTRLLRIMARLRASDGCPWDQMQSFATIASYTIEEAYEVADAIRGGSGVDGPDFPALLDELGDLLFQVVYHAQMAAELGQFGFAEVAAAIGDKMIRRHPHVFGNAAVRDSESYAVDWESQKAAERIVQAETGILAGIPSNLPALTRAAKLTRRAARVGFDWPDATGVLDKLEEEAAELRAELPDADRPGWPMRWAICCSYWLTWPASSNSTPRSACAVPIVNSSGGFRVSSSGWLGPGKARRM